MTAGKDESQAIVFDALIVPLRRFIGDVLDVLGVILDRIKARAAADAVEAARRHEPRPRILRHTIARPLLERRVERIVQRFFRNVEVAEQANKRGEHATRFGAVNGFRD